MSYRHPKHKRANSKERDTDDFIVWLLFSSFLF